MDVHTRTHTHAQHTRTGDSAHKADPAHLRERMAVALLRVVHSHQRVLLIGAALHNRTQTNRQAVSHGGSCITHHRAHKTHQGDTNVCERRRGRQWWYRVKVQRAQLEQRAVVVDSSGTPGTKDGAPGLNQLRSKNKHNRTHDGASVSGTERYAPVINHPPRGTKATAPRIISQRTD